MEKNPPEPAAPAVQNRTGDAGKKQNPELPTQEPINYTIDESAAEHAHLLDSPCANGTYRTEFSKMRAAQRKLVGTLMDEFKRLLEVDDPKTVRQAAAIQYICRSFISPQDSVDFDELVDQETYLEETVFNVMRIFGEEKHPVDPQRGLYGTPSIYDLGSFSTSSTSQPRRRAERRW